jgi:hypothetical protein
MSRDPGRLKVEFDRRRAFDYAPELRADLGFDGYSNRLLIRARKTA